MASVEADYQRFHDSPTAHHAAALQTPRQHRSPSQNYEGRRSAKPRISSHRLDASLRRRRRPTLPAKVERISGLYRRLRLHVQRDASTVVEHGGQFEVGAKRFDVASHR